MKILLFYLTRLFSFFKSPVTLEVGEEKTFFDYSSGERIKILRTAGREAQKEQQRLQKAYEIRFG